MEPRTNFLSISMSANITRNTIRSRNYFLTKEGYQNFGIRTVPTCASGKGSTHTSYIFRYFLLPILNSDSFLFIVFSAREAMSDPIIQSNSKLPFNIIMHLLARILTIFSYGLPTFFGNLFHARLHRNWYQWDCWWDYYSFGVFVRGCEKWELFFVSILDCILSLTSSSNFAYVSSFKFELLPRCLRGPTLSSYPRQ